MTVATETNVVITPTRSSNLATGGDMEGTYTTGKCNDLTYSDFTNNQVAGHAGSKAQGLTATGQYCSAAFAPSSYTQYLWYDIAFWSKRTAGTSGTVIRDVKHRNGTALIPAATAAEIQDRFYIRNDALWYQYRHTAIGMHASSSIAAMVTELGTSAFDSVLLDDVEIRSLTLASLFHEVVGAGAITDANVRASFVQSPGCAAGVVARCDDFATPANYLMAIHDGCSGMTLAKVVAGVPTALIANTTTPYCEDVAIEIRCNGTTISMWYGGVQVGTNQTVNVAGINSNTHHGIISTAVDNSCTTVSVMPYEATARWWNNWKIGCGGQSIINALAYFVQGGDTITLDPAATAPTEGFNFGGHNSNQMHLETLPSGTDGAPTTLVGNGCVIDCSYEFPYLTSKSYIDVSGLSFFNYGDGFFGFKYTTCDYLNVNDCHWTNANLVGVPDANFIIDCNNVNFYDCTVSDFISTTPTCDGFEFSESTHDCAAYRCIAHGVKNGTLDENNGHGFEAWANGTKEPYNISWVNCEAYDCRVGFSSEGGANGLPLVGIVADQCYSHDNIIYDFDGKQGATLQITSLVDRDGNDLNPGAVYGGSCVRSSLLPLADVMAAVTANAASAASADAKLDAVKLKTDTIGSLAVTVTSPVAASGTITIQTGDDYNAEDSRAITVAVADPTHALDLDDAEAVVRIKAVQATWEATGVVSTTPGYTVTFELTAAQTGVLTTSRQSYELEAVLANSNVVTLATGTLITKPNIAAVT
jgi:hypothetical protein